MPELLLVSLQLRCLAASSWRASRQVSTLVREWPCLHLPIPSTIQPLGGPNPPWLLLDCAHTELSIRATRLTLRCTFPRAALVVVLALAADKDLEAVAREVVRAAPALVLCTRCDIAGSAQRSLAPGAIAAAVSLAAADASGAVEGLREDVGHAVLSVEVCSDMHAAMTAATARVAQLQASVEGLEAVICVTGSNAAVRDAHAAAAALIVNPRS